jgi:hypothetical protein
VIPWGYEGLEEFLLNYGYGDPSIVNQAYTVFLNDYIAQMEASIQASQAETMPVYSVESFTPAEVENEVPMDYLDAYLNDYGVADMPTYSVDLFNDYGVVDMPTYSVDSFTPYSADTPVYSVDSFTSAYPENSDEPVLLRIDNLGVSEASGSSVLDSVLAGIGSVVKKVIAPSKPVVKPVQKSTSLTQSKSVGVSFFWLIVVIAGFFYMLRK